MNPHGITQAITSRAALVRLRLFEKKYAADSAILVTPSGLKSVGARQWVTLINAVVQRSTFPNDIDAVRIFIADLEKQVLFDQIADGRKEALIKERGKPLPLGGGRIAWPARPAWFFR